MTTSVYTRTIGAALLIMQLSCTPSEGDMHLEGGGWYTTFTSGHTLGRTALYRRDGDRTVRVNGSVFVRMFHPPDCLLFEPQEASGVVFAACGARQPIAVAAYAPWSPDGVYEADSTGLYAIDTVRIVDGKPMARLARVAIADIRAVAEAQPALGGSWAPSPGITLALQPTTTDEPVDANARGPRGSTALIEAARQHQVDVVESLLRAGADPNAADSSGMTALQMSVGMGDRDTAIARRLLDAGVDVNRIFKNGYAPLTFIVIGTDTAMFQLLLAKGANPCVRDEQGRTIADLASPERPAMYRAAQSAYGRCTSSR